MKYLISLLLVILVILGFSNKDTLSEYTRSNLASVYESDDYVEPERDISDTSVSIQDSTTTKNMSDVKNQPKYGYGSVYQTIWTHYYNGKSHTNSNQSYPYGTNITYYFTDWNNMSKYGFFLGWINEYTGSFFSGSERWSEYKFTLFRNTEVVSKFQSCAKPFPENVFFKDINSLERKMVSFANNVPDKNLKIKAKGEVAALVVQYGDEGVCVQFIEQCTTGSVSCPGSITDNFYNSYNGKSIKQIFHYHTHDYNSGDNSSDKRYKNYYIIQGKNKIVYIPSLTDLFQLSLKMNSKVESRIFFIKGVNDIIEKVISPDGTVYVYNMPTTGKNLDIYLNGKVDEQSSIDAFNRGLQLSMTSNKRTKPNNDDVLSGYDSILKYYQKEYSAKFYKYIIN